MSEQIPPYRDFKRIPDPPNSYHFTVSSVIGLADSHPMLACGPIVSGEGMVDTRVVLTNGWGGPDRYAIHYQNCEDGGLSQGSYYRDRAEANAGFVGRLRRQLGLV